MSDAETDTNNIGDTLTSRMDKVYTHLQEEYASLRSERAHPSLLENIKIEVYSQQMPLKGAATISISDPQTLTVTVWNPDHVKSVDNAIRNSSLSLNPRLEGNTLYISLPPMTQDRRKELISIARQKAEQAKISLRNIRRDVNDALKSENKKGDLSDDDHKEQLKSVQTATDTYIEKVDAVLKTKQQSIEQPS